MNQISPLARILLLTGLLTLTAGLFLIRTDSTLAGPAVISGLILIAISFLMIPKVKGISYTVLILAAVAASLFYPSVFIGPESYPYKNFIKPLLVLIMFGVGSTMSLRDFDGVLKMPKPVLIGIVAQFTIMPLVGYAIATTFGFSDDVAAGIILIGCVPSGLASNVMSYLAKADVALSVTLTAVATLIAPVMTPLLMQLLAGKLVNISFFAMMMDILVIVILPIGLGLVFNQFLGKRFPVLDKIMPLLSMVSIGAIITIITAGGRNKLLDQGILLLFAVLVHNLAGYLLGFQLSRILGMPEKSCRTVSLEVGLQNGGLASALALNMGAGVGLAPAIFGPLMNITGSTLASWWHNRPVKDEVPGKAAVPAK